MREEFYIYRHGKAYILFAGLLDEAHSRGLAAIDTDLIQVPDDSNGQVAITKATVTIETADQQTGEVRQATFSGIGDASPNNVSRNVANHLIRMAECVPLDAQMLTERGWKRYDELKVGEMVFAYDLEHDVLRRVPLLDVRTFEEAPLVSIKGRSIDVMCTPDHKWPVNNQRRTRAQLRPTGELKTSDHVVAAARAQSGTLRLGQRDAAILGWLATDGTLRHYHVTDRYGKWGPYVRADIAQSKPEYVEELHELTHGIAGVSESDVYEQKMPSGQVSTCQRAYRFRLRTAYLKRLLRRTGLREWPDLPEIVTQLTHTDRVAMLDAMLKGDGARNEWGRWTFGKKRKPGVMEAFEILATLEGHALGKLGHKECGAEPLPTRTLRAYRHHAASYLRTRDEGVAQVWCPSTQLGTWVMRQNGCITITGNTRAKARALRDAVNVGATSLEELTGDDDGGGGPSGSSGGNGGGSRQGSSSQGNSSQGNSSQGGSRGGAQGNGSGDSGSDRSQSKAAASQVEFLRTLAGEWRGQQGVSRLESRIGKPLSELTREEATEWIERLTPKDSAENAEAVEEQGA